MRVTFLGSSHGLPEPNRKCSCILLEVSNKKYIIDCGTSVCDSLINRRIRPSLINAIFITHKHGDHTDGLFQFVDLCTWAYKDGNTDIFVPYIGFKRIANSWIKYVGLNGLKKNIKIKKIKEGIIFNDDIIKVTACLTGHCDRSYSYIIETEGKILYFSGDLKGGSGPETDFERISKNRKFDLAVCECAHFDSTSYIEPLKNNPPKLFYLNHYSPKRTKKLDELINATKGIVDINLAIDDLSIEL